MIADEQATSNQKNEKSIKKLKRNLHKISYLKSKNIYIFLFIID
jgi:hypothetical protein